MDDAFRTSMTVTGLLSHHELAAYSALMELWLLCIRRTVIDLLLLVQVVVIGATNRIDSIDGALRRPGRFDRELLFPLPDRQVCDVCVHGCSYSLPNGLSSNNSMESTQMRWYSMTGYSCEPVSCCEVLSVLMACAGSPYHSGDPHPALGGAALGRPAGLAGRLDQRLLRRRHQGAVC
jgi:hypothetical protein